MAEKAKQKKILKLQIRPTVPVLKVLVVVLILCSTAALTALWWVHGNFQAETDKLRSEAAELEYANDLLEEKTGLAPAMWDERRTTVDAHRILSDNGVHGKKRKNTVDAVAASLILEGYLASRRRNV